MNKPNSNNKIKNSAIAAKVSLTDPGVLIFLVEMLAERGRDKHYIPAKIPAAFQTSSIVANVTGNITFDHKGGFINTSFATKFLFTCTKVKGFDYDFTWLSSLS